MTVNTCQRMLFQIPLTNEDGTGTVVTEALDEFNSSYSPCLPWNATSNPGKSGPLLLSRERTQKVGVLIVDRTCRAGVDWNWVGSSSTLGNLQRRLDVRSGCHCAEDDIKLNFEAEQE